MSPQHRSFLTSLATNGVIVALVGMVLFALNDAMGKWLVSTYSVGQVVLIRSIAALVVLMPFVWWMGWKPLVRVERPRMQAARAVLSTAEVLSFYAAVYYLPLADVMTYWLAAPIYIAAVSPFLLGEHVGWRRWTAIGIGFLGVVIALQPSAAMFNSPAAAISIVGTFFFAFMLISGRSLRGTPDTVLVFWQTVSAAIGGLVFALFDWVTPSVRDLVLLALLGVVAMTAHVLINRALKLTDASVVAPLQYTLLFWAIVFGFVFFGDLPTVPMMIGALLIIASGLFIFFREQQLDKKDKVLPAIPE
jgi:drug/metabolite transporter (DMT)-like permease